MRSEQTCLSSGYSFRFIGQASVSEIRMLYSTEPYGKIRMYTLGMIMLWKWPSFSLEKKRSGIHTRFASVSVRYFRRPANICWWFNYPRCKCVFFCFIHTAKIIELESLIQPLLPEGQLHAVLLESWEVFGDGVGGRTGWGTRTPDKRKS